MENRHIDPIDSGAFKRKFKKRCELHPLWNHTFLRMIGNCPDGLRHQVLRTWAIQAGKIDEIFVAVLERMLINPAISKKFHPCIAENLDDELGNGNEDKKHFTLFKHVLSLLGVTEKEYRETAPLAGTQVIMDNLLSASGGTDVLKILTYMASEELLCPKEFQIFVSLFSTYDSSEVAQEYFNVHISADEHHSADLIKAIGEYAKDEAQGDRNKLESVLLDVFCLQKEDMDANVSFYDSIQKEYDWLAYKHSIHTKGFD